MVKKYKRWQQDNIIKALKTRRVLMLLGPRQSGKTTICKKISSKDFIYRTLDDGHLQEAAFNDPTSFIKHDESLLIIDEIQRAPQLLLAIKKTVDEDDRVGQFLLTGSANIYSLPTSYESLAGRVRKIRLRVLSQGEIEGSKPKFLAQAFKQNFKNQTQIKCSQEDVLSRAFNGGFPEVLRLAKEERKSWHKDYISALLDRDLKDISNIKNVANTRLILEVLAAWSSKFMDVASISSTMGLSRDIVENSISALEILFIVEVIPAWFKTDYARVTKRRKILMCDSGLMCSILGYNDLSIRLNVDQLGKIVETFVFNELMVQIGLSQDEYTMFHYRDKDKREIDFVVERSDGSILAIEVKSGTNISKDSFKHIKWFTENIAKDREVIAIVFYTGEYILSFGKNMWALPISILWE